MRFMIVIRDPSWQWGFGIIGFIWVIIGIVVAVNPELFKSNLFIGGLIVEIIFTLIFLFLLAKLVVDDNAASENEDSNTGISTAQIGLGFCILVLLAGVIVLFGALSDSDDVAGETEVITPVPTPTECITIGCINPTATNSN